MELIASAPGKVFLLGEYSVLASGSAIVATVSRRLYCRVRSRPGSGQLRVRRGRVEWKAECGMDDVGSVPPELRFAAAAALVGVRALALEGQDIEVETDSETESELDGTAGKLGLGSSAAVTAATLAGLSVVAGRPAGDAAWALERAVLGAYAHRCAQQGGSGADVVASTMGGMTWIAGLDTSDPPTRVGEAVRRARAGSPIRCERLRLPESLAFAVVATGRPSASAPRVARFLALLNGADAARARVAREWCRGMDMSVDAFRVACGSDDAPAVVAAVRLAAELLGRLGAVAAIPVYEPGLRRACRASSAIAVKPSGAGGGDCAVALVRREDRAALRAEWRAAGLVPAELELGGLGASCSPGISRSGAMHA